MNPCSILTLGAPNTGKSTLLASIANIVGPENVALIALRPKEKNSWGYKVHGIDETATVITDRRWQPDLDQWQADGYRSLLELLQNKMYDHKTLRAVILDPLTDAVELVSHNLLADEKAPTPRDLPGKNASLAYYGSARKKMVNLIKAGVELTVAPNPKFFLTAVHTKPIHEENMVAPNKVTADVRARGTRFHGEVVPLLEGSYKFDLAGDFDLKLYTDVEVPRGRETMPSYRVQVVADKDRFAGISLAPALDVKYLPNDLREVFTAIEKALK